MIVGYIKDGVNRYALFTAANGADSVLRCEAEFYLNEVDSAHVTLPETNRAALSLTQKNAVIVLEDDGDAVFIGDVALTKQEDSGEVHVDLDGALGWLGRICKAPFQVREGDANSPVANFLSAIVTQYNASAGADRILQLGAVTVTGSVVLDHHDEYVTMLDLLGEVREQLGGYVYMDYASGIPVLNYIAAPETADGQVLEFGRNVLTVVNQLDFSSYASRVYVAGTDDNDQLITSVAADETAEATFGRVDVSLRGEGKTTEEIYAEALAELAARKAPLQSLTMTAADLAELGYDEKLFTIGTARRAYCEPIGIDTRMLVRKIKRDYLNRKNSEVSFGRDVATLSGSSGSTRGGSIGGGGVYVLPESVLYTLQVLTAEEQAQARQNIGAAAISDIPQASLPGVSQAMNGKILGVVDGVVMWIDPPSASQLPPYTAADEGKVLGIVNGALAWVEQSGGGGESAIYVTDNGNGDVTITGVNAVENDGTITIIGLSAVDDGAGVVIVTTPVINV